MDRLTAAMRVLIFSADIGEGHNLPARVLRVGILRERPDADVKIVDTLDAAGPPVRAVVRRGAQVVLGRFGRLFDLQYWLVSRFAPTRALAGGLVTALARRGLRKAVAAHRPDVVVCTYPLASEVLGRLRAAGHLEVPVVSAITDLAALHWWAHRGCDLHLVIHPESAGEIREVAGASARVEAVRGLTGSEFERPGDPDATGLPTDRPLVAVSGGGWAVGDLDGAVRAALAARPDIGVVALCGRNEAVRDALGRAFGDDPRVHVLGFADRMGDVLAAVDVLIHSTAGLTAFEALVRGTRVISYGWGIGHVRINNRAYRRLGLAEVVAGRAALTDAVRRALDSPRRPDLAYAARPAAPARILALVTGAPQDGDRARRAEQAAPA